MFRLTSGFFMCWIDNVCFAEHATQGLGRNAMRCSTNWAMKPHIGSEVNLLSSYLPWGVKWCEVYEIIHFWTAVVDERRSLKKKKKEKRQRGGHGFESRWSPDFFSGFFLPIAYVGKFTAMIILHSHLPECFLGVGYILLPHDRRKSVDQLIICI